MNENQEREAFEAAMKEIVIGPWMLAKQEGEYAFNGVRLAWEAWQARAALAATPAPAHACAACNGTGQRTYFSNDPEWPSEEGPCDLCDGTGQRAATPAPVEPVAWGMRDKTTGLILDVICPDEHESFEGDYTVPLFAATVAATPAAPQRADDADRLLREVFALCEATEDAPEELGGGEECGK